MKFSVTLFILPFFMAQGSVRHEVILRNGNIIGGYVSEMKHDSLKIVPEIVGIPTSLAIDSILYIHNSNGKLFYLAPDIRKFFDRGMGRGGVITTIYGEEICYRRLGRELFMFKPKLVYITKEVQMRQEIALVEIHKVRLDHSVSEYAVKKGAMTGASLTSILFLLKFKAFKEFFNFSKIYNTGIDAYKTATTFIPMTTIGWVVYDFFNGERELILNPLRSK